MLSETPHPYERLPRTSFWSGGVCSPVSARQRLSLEPLVGALGTDVAIVSAGSCFAQYIGAELTSRKFRYLRSRYSADRIESFGVGNLYSLAQLRQWLEFVLNERVWAETCAFEGADGYTDYLLPHCEVVSTRKMLDERRELIAEEMRQHLQLAKCFIFTIGLTETWRNSRGDVLPICPGTLIGRFDGSEHVFSSSTFNEILADLEAVELLLARINSTLEIVYTVSPVPLTATATEEHVLLATTHSKSIIRAALGEFCKASLSASYFPSYELINHHLGEDWRFEKNLRTVSRSGVKYVMSHAFADSPMHSLPAEKTKGRSSISENENPVCEEEMLDAYSRTCTSVGKAADILLIGDSHMSRLAKGLESIGVDTFGGQVMNGSGFSDGKLEDSDETIFKPLESPQSREIWLRIHDRLKRQIGRCSIVTNIGFQTHRTIAQISNSVGTPVMREADITDYLETNYRRQFRILAELTKFGKVWMVEDPNFYAFLSNDAAGMVSSHNFHPYCACVRKIARRLGIGYLNPCQLALHRHFEATGDLIGIVESDGTHGTQLYYEYCAEIIHGAISQV